MGSGCYYYLNIHSKNHNSQACSVKRFSTVTRQPLCYQCTIFHLLRYLLMSSQSWPALIYFFGRPRSGVIQAGDSLLAIQGDSPLGKTIDKLTARYLLNPSLETSSSSTSRHLALVTQYTVSENVIPSSGVFDVRIIRRSASLGINLQGKCVTLFKVKVINSDSALVWLTHT